jgi:hypothetical protein
MSPGYAAFALTDAVRAAEARMGSATAIGRRTAHDHVTTAAEPRDALTGFEQEFIADRDGFYLASVSPTGWPYVQFRGGLPGFVHSPDSHTLTWADFRGNRQYTSTGNVADDDRVALFFMDYPHRLRLKVFGRARFTDAREQPDAARALVVPGDRGVVEQIVTVTVAAYDSNCQQHITPRYTLAELHPSGSV